MATGNMEFLQWDRDKVARWIESIGFPQYKACFTENYITGRKLIYVNCASLPRLGVTHFKDMQIGLDLGCICDLPALYESDRYWRSYSRTIFTKGDQVISACVRELLGITEVPWSRSIADPRRDTRGLFLERKGRTGVQADNLTWQQFLDDMSQTERERARTRSESQREKEHSEIQGTSASVHVTERQFVMTPTGQSHNGPHSESFDINTSHQ